MKHPSDLQAALKKHLFTENVSQNALPPAVTRITNLLKQYDFDLDSFFRNITSDIYEMPEQDQVKWGSLFNQVIRDIQVMTPEQKHAAESMLVKPDGEILSLGHIAKELKWVLKSLFK
jgi:hypothetical protein